MTRPRAGEVVTIGETMALFSASAAGTLRSGAGITFSIGGAESNVAVGMARLGAGVIWMGRVGRDAFGDEVIRVLRGEGIDVRTVRDVSRQTGLMVKERRTTIHQRVAYYRAGSAGAGLSREDVDDSAIAAARVLHLTGITPALSRSAASTVEHAIEVARDAETLISLDVNYRSALWSRAEAAEALGRLQPFVDILFAGPDEAELLLDSSGTPEQLATALARTGPSQVIVKHGASGATAVIDGQRFTATPPSVPVIDTVGAGDSFVAGYLTGLLAGESPQKRLDLGCVAGAFACMAHGDWEGAPTWDDLALLASADPVIR